MMRVLSFEELESVNGGWNQGAASIVGVILIERAINKGLDALEKSVKDDQEERKRLGIETEPIRSPEENNVPSQGTAPMGLGFSKRREMMPEGLSL